MKSLLIILLALCGGLAKNSAAASDRPAPLQTDLRSALSDQLVVDRMEVHGDTHTSRDLLESYLDLPLGRSITQDRLQEHLAKFRLKLEALGYFKKVDVRLAKGSILNHYVVVVELDPISWFYTGMDHQYTTSKERPFSKKKELRETVYFGSRNLFGTGKMVDFSLGWYDSSQNFSRNDTCQSRVQSQELVARFFDPSLGGTPYLAGVSGSVVDYSIRFKNCKDLDNDHLPRKIKKQFQAYSAFVGRRFGLTTLNLNANTFLRNGSLRDSNREDRMGLNLKYTEKSYLSAVESGSVFKFNLEKNLNSSRDSAALEMQHTRFLLPKHALTGEVDVLVIRYHRDISPISGMTLALLYQWVPPWDWVFGVEPRLYLSKSKPQYAGSLTAHYLSPSFLMSFALKLGEGFNGSENTAPYRQDIP